MCCRVYMYECVYVSIDLADSQAQGVQWCVTVYNYLDKWACCIDLNQCS